MANRSLQDRHDKFIARWGDFAYELDQLEADYFWDGEVPEDTHNLQDINRRLTMMSGKLAGLVLQVRSLIRTNGDLEEGEITMPNTTRDLIIPSPEVKSALERLGSKREQLLCIVAKDQEG